MREEKKLSVNIQSFALVGWNFTHVKKEKKPKKINNQGGEKLDWISKVSCWHIRVSDKIKKINPTLDIRSFALTCYKLENAYYNIFGNVYLRLELHMDERGEKAREEKKTLNLVEPLSPIECPSSTKLKEKKKGVDLAPSCLQNECWNSTKMREKKMSKLHIGKKKNVDAPRR